MAVKPPLWRQQRALPALHEVGVQAAAHELARCLTELLPRSEYFNAQEVDLLAARIVMAYWRGASGDGVT